MNQLDVGAPAKFLRNGYSQMSLTGMSCSRLVNFFPRPVVRPTLIQLLLGHLSLATTSRDLKIATSTVCATISPLDLLPRIEPPRANPPAVV